MGLRDLRRRRGREGRRGPSPPPCCRPGRRGGPVIASGRERGDTGRRIWSAAYSMARRRFWKRARRQWASSRPRCSLPRAATMAPAALLEATRWRSASPPAVPPRRALGILTVSCRRDAVPRSLAPALPRGKGRRPATHRRQREQRRPELAPPPRVGRRGEMPTRPNPAVGGRCRRASLPPASTGPAPPPSADRLAAPPHAWRGTRHSPEDLRRGCRRIWAPEVGEYGNGGRRLGRGWRGK
jgi:hypothetical protein